MATALPVLHIGTGHHRLYGRRRTFASLSTSSSLLKLVLGLTIVLSPLAFYFSSIAATANSTINFQAKIVQKTTGLNVVNGTPACVASGADTCDFRVSIYSDPAAGTLLWQETHSNVEIGDTGGLFNLSLNSVCNSWTAPGGGCSGSGLTWGSDSTIYMQLEFSPAGDGTFTETFARKLFSSVPYAYYADVAGSINGLDSSGFVQLSPAATQDTTATTPLISLNENGAGSQNLLELKVGGVARMVLNNDGQLQLPATGGTVGLLLGGDTTLYRYAGDLLYTDDSFAAATNLYVGGTTTSSPFYVDSATNAVRIGDGANDANDPSITFYASDATNSGTLSYLDNDSFYFNGGGVHIGAAAETITNASFNVSTNGLYVAGAVGVELNIYTDGALVAGGGATNLTVQSGTISQGSGNLIVQSGNSASSLLQLKSRGTGGTTSGAIELYPNSETDDWLYFMIDTVSTAEGVAMYWEGVQAYTNDPGVRINANTGQLEYRDQDESTWTTIDSLINVGSSLFTDAGTVTYLTSTTDDFAIGATTTTAPFSVTVATNVVRIGDGANDTNDPTLTFYASDATNSGSLSYLDADGFYLSGGGVYVGASAETIDNAGFSVGTNGLYIAGSAGVEGSVYADSSLVVGTTTYLTLQTGTISQSSGNLAINAGTGGSVTVKSVANSLNLQSNNDTDDYLYVAIETVSATDAMGIFWEGVQAYTNDPGVRINANTGELEYRDENESAWTTIDSLINTGSSLFTDAGTVTYLTSTTDDFALGSTTTTAPFSVTVATNVVRIGDGTSDANDPTVTFYASDATNSGSLSYLDNDSFYFSGGGVHIGAAAETITNGTFAVGTDGLYVGGMVGVEGNIYTDGALVAGGASNLTVQNGTISQGSGTLVIQSGNSATSLLQLKSRGTGGTTAGAVEVYPNSDTDDWLYFMIDTVSTAEGVSMYWEGVQAYANDPGVRINANTGELEYRDENESAWTSLDSLSAGGSLFTDGGTVTYLTATADNFAIGATTTTAPFSVTVASNDVRIGDGTNDANDPTITFFASDATDSGSLSYLDSDDFYFSGGSVMIGATAETIANAGFVPGGNSLYIAGMLGVESDIYTDTSVFAATSVEVAGTLTATSNTLQASGLLNLKTEGDTDDYIYFDAIAGASDTTVAILWEGESATNDPGIRVNPDDSKMQYRDENSATWVNFDDSLGLWTDGGTLTYRTDQADDFGIGGTSLTNSEFSFDVGLNAMNIGVNNASTANNPMINFRSSEATSDTGSLEFTDNDSFYFNGANVGIGINNATSPLHVFTAGASLAKFENDVDYARITLDGAGGGGNDIIFQRNGTSDWGLINTGSTIGFYDSDNLSNGKLTIGDDGNVTVAAGLKVGTSTSTTAGTLRWSGTTLDVYSGGYQAIYPLASTSLKTQTATSTGSITNGTNTNVAFNDYSFYPNIRVTATDDTIDTKAYDGASTDTVGRVKLQCAASSNGNCSYALYWRYVTASRPGEIFAWYDTENEKIVQIVVSELSSTTELPITSDEAYRSTIIPIQATIYDPSLSTTDAAVIMRDYKFTEYAKASEINENHPLVKDRIAEQQKCLEEKGGDKSKCFNFNTNKDIYYGKLEKCPECANINAEDISLVDKSSTNFINGAIKIDNNTANLLYAAAIIFGSAGMAYVVTSRRLRKSLTLLPLK